MSLYKFVSS